MVPYLKLHSFPKDDKGEKIIGREKSAFSIVKIVGYVRLLAVNAYRAAASLNLSLIRFSTKHRVEVRPFFARHTFAA
jgi:hypothetical protein